MASKSSAPTFEIPPREIVAVEHPMIIKNLDNGLKTFGTNRPFKRILDSNDPDECLPLYLRPNDPMCVPILSHNTPSNNLLLKVTLPKRTGRKRKRGSQGPYTRDVDFPSIPPADRNGPTAQPNSIRSQSRLDTPAKLLQTLRDTVDMYSVEIVGEVKQTHRFRGLPDFAHSTSHTEFMSKFQETVLLGNSDIQKVRQFKFNLDKGWKPNEEFLPPPAYTTHALPFNWGWHQNKEVVVEVDQDTGTSKLINKTKCRPIEVELLRNDADSVPHDAPELPTDDPDLLNLVLELQKAMEERPIWTRRALTNRVGFSPTLHLLRAALHYVGYQFTGGPFRDCLIKYGLDPREDKKYRIYQTFFFKIYDDVEKTPGMPWHDVRPPYKLGKRSGEEINSTSHIFDGKNLTLDGKVWMACDITDPLLAQLIRDAPYRAVCETSRDGWFFNGTMAKIKAVMRMKLIAIRVQKQLPLNFFQGPLATPDVVPAKPTSKGIAIPMPKIILTEAEIASLREQGVVFTLDSNGLRTTEFKVGARAARLRKKLSKKKESKGKYTLSGKYRRKTKPKPKVPSKEQSNGAAGESNNADTRDTNLDSSIDRALLTISQSGSIRLNSTDSVSVAGTPNASSEMDGGSGESGDVGRLEDLGEDEDGEEGDSEEDIEGDSTTESDEDDDGSGTDGEGEGDFDSDPADGVDHTRYFADQMGYDDPDE